MAQGRLPRAGVVGLLIAAIRYDNTVGESDLNDPAELERLGIDLPAPDAADTLKLVRYVVEQGAGRRPTPPAQGLRPSVAAFTLKESGR